MGFEHIAEKKIREAIEQGGFNNLKGQGKPLVIVDDDFTGDDWAGLHVLKSNGFLPEWLELRKQVYLERDTVYAAMEEWADAIRQTGSRFHPLATRAAENYVTAAKAINARIDLHNIRCPSFQLEVARFREDAQPSLG